MNTKLRALALAVVLAFVATPGGARERARASAILHFNDIHGRLEPWKPDARVEGRVVRRR
jgi:hypothetical protein